ncbi:hypothetical protein BHE74_00050410 [Ensete ventricosum]|nr:hypothetical protein BHE74_00050410 [Ensete ventricosum]RZS23586.1 hypothetical protein BHM03_00056554 [Ensete ventricosum]
MHEFVRPVTPYSVRRPAILLRVQRRSAVRLSPPRWCAFPPSHYRDPSFSSSFAYPIFSHLALESHRQPPSPSLLFCASPPSLFLLVRRPRRASPTALVLVLASPPPPPSPFLFCYSPPFSSTVPCGASSTASLLCIFPTEPPTPIIPNRPPLLLPLTSFSP